MSNDLHGWPTPARVGSGAFRLVTGAMSLARRVIIELIDDIDGDAAIETVALSYRGVEYEVDLSARNAAALDEALAPYLQAARRVPVRRAARRTPARSTGGSPNPKDVRAWARSEGIEISDRGRVRTDVIRRYVEAHGA